MRTSPGPSTLIVYVAACFALAGNAGAQSTKVIEATDPRPLWPALDQLERMMGAAINYEDVPYENIADVQDVSTPQERAATPGFQQIVPRAGGVRIEIPEKAKADSVDLVAGINLLLISYRSTKLPGDYKVEEANGMYYVTPTHVLGANGKVRAVVSPLSTAVTIPYAKRRVDETLDAVFDAVLRATGQRIVLGDAPFYPKDVVSFGATNELARDVLARLFSVSGKGPLSYRLLFDPKLDRNRIFDYVMHLTPVGYVSPTVAANPATVETKPSNGMAPPVSFSADGPNRTITKQ
jgi:hypothetical protein